MSVGPKPGAEHPLELTPSHLRPHLRSTLYASCAGAGASHVQMGHRTSDRGAPPTTSSRSGRSCDIQYKESSPLFDRTIVDTHATGGYWS